MRAITFRRFGSKIVFDDAGIHVTPILFAPYSIDWSQVEFINPIPTYEKRGDNWVLSNSDHDAAKMLERRSRLNLRVVVSDFHDIPIHAGQNKMVDANGKATGEGYFDLRLRTNYLNGTLSELLDVLESQTRFDLLIAG